MDEQLFSSDAELQVVINILYALSMHDTFNIRAMNPYMIRWKKSIEVHDKFINNWLTMFFDERMAYVNLFDDNLELCRQKCKSY